MISLATTATAAALPTVVPISQHRGFCAASGLATSDTFVSANGTTEEVIGIAKVLDGGRVVGWIYRTATGRYYVQANERMSERDREISHTPVARERREYILYRSPLRQIESNPWSDLKTMPCQAADFSKHVTF